MYGDWLVLSAIPTYFGLSDLGFGTASGSDMTVRVAAGDRDGALNTFQSSWVLVTIVSVACLCAGLLVNLLLQWTIILHLSTVTEKQASWTFVLLVMYVVVCQQTSIMESGYRCDGNFALGTAFLSATRIAEGLLAPLAALAGGGLVAAALAYLLVRGLATVVYFFLLMHKSPWLSLGFSHATLQTIRDLATPAAGFIAIPAGQAVSLQGMTILVGTVLGPIAVVIFSTLRTLSRLAFQMFNMVTIALWPELSAAFGAGRIAQARSLHRHACRAAVSISLLTTSSLWLSGPYVYRLWTHNAVPFRAGCFHILLCVVIANSIWYASSVVPMSTNAHARIAFYYLLSAVLSLGLCWVGMHYLGVAGAAAGLLVMESLMIGVVVPTALRLVDDTAQSFWTSILSPAEFFTSLRGMVVKLNP